MGRISRSFQLVGQSYRILMRDKELMVLPVISGTIIVAIMVGIFFGFGLRVDQVEAHGADTYLPALATYVSVYAVSIFFQAAVIAGATERMRGGDPTVSSALGAAASRLGPILMWALFAGTVGLLLEVIHERVGFIGRIITRLVGAAWSLATLFIVPVLVLEDRTVTDSFKQSVSVFRQTWGETMVGNASVGLVAFFAWIALGLVVWLFASMGAVVLAVLAAVAGAILIAAFASALSGVYVASLYRYATEGHVTSGYDESLLASAFVPKH
jgi:hypothetical protein